MLFEEGEFDEVEEVRVSLFGDWRRVVSGHNAECPDLASETPLDNELNCAVTTTIHTPKQDDGCDSKQCVNDVYGKESSV